MKTIFVVFSQKSTDFQRLDLEFRSVRNNNHYNVHLSCAHQCPQRLHDTY